jgi:mannose-6-phosphate isomerase-like protein (cupin superfamily)
MSTRRRRPPRREELRVHDGHDWMYVLDGRMRLLLGDQDLVVEPGEAVEFSTLTPHWFGTIDGPVQLIAVLEPTASAPTSKSEDRRGGRPLAADRRRQAARRKGGYWSVASAKA